MATPAPVDQLVDDAIFCSAEYQVTLADALQRYSWTIDVTQGSIVLAGATEIRAQIQVLGTLGDDAWWWAWDDRQLPELPASARQCVRVVQSYGHEYALADFAVSPVPARPDLGHRLTLAAKAITGQYLHFVCAPPGAEPVYLLLTGTGIDPAPVTTSIATAVIHQGLVETAIYDHRRALSSWAQLRGFGHREDAGEVVLELADGDLRVGCQDERIVSIDGRAIAAAGSRGPDAVPSSNGTHTGAHAAGPAGPPPDSPAPPPDPLTPPPAGQLDAGGEPTPIPEPDAPRSRFGRLFRRQ